MRGGDEIEIYPGSPRLLEPGAEEEKEEEGGKKRKGEMLGLT